MPITNVEVSRGSEHAEYALMWESQGARFHVWITDKLLPSSAILFKNALLNIERTDPGFFQTRRLQLVIGKNKAMFDDAMEQAMGRGLFEKCDEVLKQAEKERLARAAEEYKVTLAQQAGPQMLGVLKAIAEFWSDEQHSFPLAPGALILSDDHFLGGGIMAKPSALKMDPDNHETIADAVRRVVALAEVAPAPAQSEVPATTAHWCPKGEHAYRCSHEENERCAHGDHSEVNCPEHGGPKSHPRKAVA